MQISTSTGATRPGFFRRSAWSRAGRRAAAAVSVGALLSVAAGGVAWADDVYNTIDGTTAAMGAIDVQVESMPLVAGGATGATSLRVQAKNSGIDGFEGCNLQAGPLVLAVQSSDETIATVKPETVTLTACSTASVVHEQGLTVTPVGAGTATISVSVTSSGTGAASFNLLPAVF